jgi:drug/metabolite transporter (DMT)-like permease
MQGGGSKARPELLASFVVFFAGGLWGFYWFPLRATAAAGIAAPWAIVAIGAVATLVLLPFTLWRWRRALAAGWPLLAIGLLVGSAFVAYNTSLLSTEVARALLLFYLTPVWGSLAGRLFLNERITAPRLAAIGLGLAGLYVVLGASGPLPIPQRLGDWLALSAGIIWTLSTVVMRKYPGIHSVDMNTVIFGCNLIGSILLPFLLTPASFISTAPSAAELGHAWPWILCTGGLLWPLTQLALFWAVPRVEAGRSGLLLLSEAMVGIATAAAITDEPFGWCESIGSALILGAALLDTLGVAAQAKLQPRTNPGQAAA